MLLFGSCLPLPMKKTTPVRVIIFNVYLGKTFMSSEGVMSSVCTAAIIFTQHTCGGYLLVKFSMAKTSQFIEKFSTRSAFLQPEPE